MAKKVHDDTLTIAELQRRAERARTLMAELRTIFTEARALAAGDRRRSQGKFDAVQSDAMRSMIDGIELRPALFAHLADEDQGHDPDKLETDLLRDRLARHDVYGEIGDELEQLGALMHDTSLAVGAQVRPVILAAYEVAKPASKHDDTLRAKVAPLLDYFSGNAQAAADARKANKKSPT